MAREDWKKKVARRLQDIAAIRATPIGGNMYKEVGNYILITSAHQNSERGGDIRTDSDIRADQNRMLHQGHTGRITARQRFNRKLA